MGREVEDFDVVVPRCPAIDSLKALRRNDYCRPEGNQEREGLLEPWRKKNRQASARFDACRFGRSNFYVRVRIDDVYGV